MIVRRVVVDAGREPVHSSSAHVELQRMARSARGRGLHRQLALPPQRRPLLHAGRPAKEVAQDRQRERLACERPPRPPFMKDTLQVTVDS